MAPSSPGQRAMPAVLLAGVMAQLSVATVGALPLYLLPLSGFAYVGAGLAARNATPQRAQVLRVAGTALTLVAIAAVLPRLLGAPDRAEIKGQLGLLLIAAQIGQALGWRTLRDLRSSLLASFGLLVLSASYAPDMLIGAPLLGGWVAVVLGLARLGGVGRVEAARAASLAVALGLAAFLVVPAPPTDGAILRLGNRALAADATRLPTDAFTTDRLDLRVRGSLSSTGILRVPRDSPPLWRATSFDTYDGTGWTRDPSAARLTTAGPPYQVSTAAGPVRTDVAERLPGARTDGTVWSPGQVVAIAGSIGTPIVDPEGDVRLFPSGRRYTVTSLVPETAPDRLRSTRGQDQVGGRYLELPASLPSRVGDLARQITQGTESRYSSAALIAQYLRQHATYRLDSPVPGPGEDAVDRFLFVDQTGFCEQFASAQVVLLRTLGIPARLVTGLGYGVREGDRRLFRVSDLHAWAELWVPGTGWVASDPTAGVPLANPTAGQSLRQRLSDAVASALRRLSSLPGGRPLLAVVVIAAGLLLSFGLSRRARRPRPPATATTRRSTGPALAAFLRWDATRGDQGRRPSESLRELRRRAGSGLGDALVIVERECYAPAVPESEVRAAVAVLDRASAQEPAGRRAPRGRLGGRGRRARRG